ncbi:MAG: HAD family hydrolase [Spirochaetes bacterium]|nr:HAD family hydrolase [Spirochaetota bacterium]MBU0957094.1 HAD family hydrolase [Spirochaetota bacterium]
MIQACIFDLDGTLVDTLEDIAGFVNPILRAHSWPEHPVEDYRLMVGRGFRNLLKIAIPAEAVVDFDALFAESLQIYKDQGEQAGKPYPGVETTLHTLKQAGQKLAVVSNKPDVVTQVVVRKTFPEHRFVLVRGAIDGQPVKPHPAGALEAAAAAGVPAAACAFIGDSDVDIATAKAAGMLAVGAAWGFRGRAELLAAGADHILERIDELPELLVKLGQS